MFKNKFVSLSILCLYCLFGTLPLEAATIHALLVGDTNDASLGNAMHKNINSFHAELQKISILTGLELHAIVVTGTETKLERVLSHVENMDVQADDVVITYFSMHGYRTPSKQNQWPNVFFGQEGAGLDLDYVVQEIIQKNPRLYLAMADSCNNVIPDGYIPTIAKMALNFQLLLNEQKNYKKLFVESRGIIISSGSEPGQYSWGNPYVGTFLTMSFLTTLKNSVGKPEVTWFDVIEGTKSEVANYMRIYNIDPPQVPQFHIILD